MPDIEPVRGLIELEDRYTSTLGLAEAALDNFTKKNQESLTAVAGAAGLVAATIGAITTATIKLGERGADVNDVTQTLEHFAGGAEEAEKVMEQLRQGTKNTVDNFTLAKDAAHLLSAGVKLTADDFGTLSQASFVLQNRGLGPTKDQLQLVSDALVTGRTRALSMALGVVDLGDAQDNYAKSLGVTKDQLSDTGKVEANRIQVMKLLKDAVKDAGEQERDFGEEIEAAETKISNFVDDIGSAVASSPAFAAAIRAIKEGLADTFGGDSQDAVKGTVEFIKQAAIVAVDFSMGIVEGARVVHTAWAFIETTILGVETVIVSAAHEVIAAIADIAAAGEKLHVVPKGMADSIKEIDVQIEAMAQSLAHQTEEANKGVNGTSEFDKVLDKLNGTLFNVKDALEQNNATQDKSNEKTDIAANNARKLAEVQKQLTQSLVDQDKIAKELIKSSGELASTWADYYALVVKGSATSMQAQQAAIEATFQKQVAALDALDPLYNEKYQAYAAIARESLRQIEGDWDSVKDNSIEGLQEQADKALNTYEMMVTSGLHFSRDVLDAQIQKYHDLIDQIHGIGPAVQQTTQVATQAIQVLDHSWVTDADIAAATINKTTIMVKTLTGELISLAEAQKRQQQGGTFDVTINNFQKAISDFLTGGGTGVSGKQQIYDPNDLARKGYSFAEIIKYAFDPLYRNALPPPQGPRIPGFAEGGTVMVGENGPEVVRLPLGSTVYPSGTRPTGGGDTIQNHYWNVRGDTAAEVAQKVKRIVMGELKSIRQYPSA